MPQFDLNNFVPQLAWLALFFAILYFGIVRLTLPKMDRVMNERSRTVEGDLSAAETSKAAADAARDAYARDISGAQARAQAAVADAKASATRDTTERLAAVGAEIEQRTAAAQASIDAARTSAMAEVSRIAEEATLQIVERLTGKTPDRATVARALVTAQV